MHCTHIHALCGMFKQCSLSGVDIVRVVMSAFYCIEEERIEQVSLRYGVCYGNLLIKSVLIVLC